MNNKVVFILTKGCNLNCVYCYEKTFNDNIEFMALSTFTNILNTFKDETIDIELFGGEPLLNTKVIDYLVDNYSDLNIDNVTISTNGLLIDDRLIGFYEAHLGKIRYIVSLDSNKVSHDLYRLDLSGKGSYDRVLNNLKKFNDKSLIFINTCITPFSSGYFYDGTMELFKFGFKNFKFIIIYELEWGSDYIKLLISGLLKLKSLKKLIDISISAFENSSLLQKNGDCKNDMEAKYRFNYNGDLVPCTLYLSEFSSKVDIELGNVNESGFDLKENFNKNINYFFNGKSKFLETNICDYYSGINYNNNKTKISRLIAKLVDNDQE